MESRTKYSLAPFIILTFIYFIVGFLTTVNGQFQGPLQVAFLSNVEELRNTLVTLIPFFFFLGYLINSSLGGRWIDLVGYKTTLMRALYFMIGGFLFYLGSSYVATYYTDWGVRIGSDYVPWGYFIFLIGSFLMGTSAAILQVVINPYVNAYELPGTQAVQRMSIVCAINSFGTTIAPFFVTGVMFAGVSLASVTSDQLILPFILMTIFIVVVTAVTYRQHLPNIEGTFTTKRKERERSIWSFSHLKWGLIAIFFYVGGEVCIGVNVNLHAMELIESGRPLLFMGSDRLAIGSVELGIPALLATLYWGGLMVGRFLSSFTSTTPARTQLIATASMAIVLTFLAIFTENLWVLITIGLCHSIMWGAIFTLAVKGLGEYTSKASGLFMMGVFGGAIFPLIQGAMADSLGSWQWTWGIVVICELVILYYAVWGSRVRSELSIINH
ncbi:MAG: MFS transporter [Rikenellaceae bacterium]